MTLFKKLATVATIAGFLLTGALAGIAYPQIRVSLTNGMTVTIRSVISGSFGFGTNLTRGNGDIVYLGTTPTITSGISTTTPSIAGSASSFKVTVAATPGATGTIAFNGTWTNVPTVNCTNTITPNMVQAVPTTTTVVLNGVWLNGDIIRCTAIGY